ncbi:unnamed protein product [Polarella glacialis]|uniref:Uncharacterized protein n=1 Tax=Polarella glacialis TaxID=89957 RepID=A0A813ERG7_POLGL|nr:unnamed protein product [Polarella glacialis]
MQRMHNRDAQEKEQAVHWPGTHANSNREAWSLSTPSISWRNMLCGVLQIEMTFDIDANDILNVGVSNESNFNITDEMPTTGRKRSYTAGGEKSSGARTRSTRSRSGRTRTSTSPFRTTP